MSKELWIEAHEKVMERLEEQGIDREPTDEEVDEEYRDMFATMIDTARLNRKYKS